TIGQPRAVESRLVHTRSIIKTIESLEVHRQIARRVAGIVETAFWNSADQWHLAPFETNADRTARAGSLALASSTAGFAVTAGFALAKPLAAVFGARTRFAMV